MPDYIPKPDQDALAYTDNLIAALEANEADYGGIAAQFDPLRVLHSTFSNALTASNTAKAQAQVAVSAKDAARADLEAALRPTVQQIQVNPDVTDASRVAAGIPLRDTVRTFSNPIPPTDLVAVANSNGVNALDWEAGGNTSGIQYVVEAKIGSASEFSTVDVVTASKYNHVGQAPGVAVQYRIRARRGAAISAPSNVAAVYS